MALSSLAQSKLRSFLTMLGIIIGVASVITVIAVGEGVKREVSDSITDLGSHLINVTPGQSIVVDEDGEQSGFNPMAGFGASTLTNEDVEAIQNLESVDSVAPLAILSGVPSSGDNQAPGAVLIATTSEVLDVLDQPMREGTYFESSDLTSEEPAYEAVLGGAVAETLFPNTSPIGQEVVIRGETFQVIGVLDTDESASAFTTEGSLHNSVQIPFDTANDFIGNVNINEINIQADPSLEVEGVADEIHALLLENHGGEEDFTVLTQDDMLATFDDILGMLTNFIGAIAAISLLVGGIGVANIMLVSVTERTREIGIRKAVGATRMHIMMQFLIEAVVLSIIGGLLGVAAAIGLTQIIEAQADIVSVFTPMAFLLALGVSGIVGVVFGLAPAIKAARKRPIQALKYE